MVGACTDGVLCLYSQEQIALREELAALNPLTGLTQLLLAANMSDVRLDALQLGGNVLVMM